MHKKFEVNRTKIKGGCQSARKAAEMKSYSKMPRVLKGTQNYAQVNLNFNSGNQKCLIKLGLVFQVGFPREENILKTSKDICTKEGAKKF